MKVTFTITDETVVTSNTVKVIVNISGQVGEDDRTHHEARARELSKAFISTAEWAYSNFQYGPNGLTFSVQGTCRIPAEQNQELATKAQEVSTKHTTLTISNLDLSVPPRDLTKGESLLRKRMLERAQEAATDLGDFEVTEIEFSQHFSGGAKSMSNVSNATYAVSESDYGVALGHSEKIALSAEVTVRTRQKPEDNANVVQLNG